MSRSPRAWWRAACAGALILLAAAGPALLAPGPGAGAEDAAPHPAVSFVVGRARFEPLDGTLPVGAAGLGDYAGTIEVVPDGASVAVVNDVSVEDYVAGISEVPSEWPAAALQAQAIAARTYLLHGVRSPSPAMAAVGAEICASQDCQVYRGLAKGRAPFGRYWLDAVRATAGQVLLYNGRPINAMYSSSNGGRTVAGGEPYLRAVDDPDDTVAPLDRWTVDVGLPDLAHALQMPGAVTSISRSEETISVTSAEPGAGAPAGSGPTTSSPAASSTGATPTASSSPTGSPPAGSSPAADASPSTTTLPAELATTTTSTSTSTSSTMTAAPPNRTAPAKQQRSLTISAADFTRRVNGALPPAAGRDVLLPSDRFAVTQGSSTATFTGGGFGHGIGMSQYGALGKANRGLSASDILAFYYGGLRPRLLPMTAVPRSVRVDLADGLASTSITGRFRLVDEHHNVLVPLADGPWQVEPAPGGRVRVLAAASYRGPGAAPSVGPPMIVPAAAVAPGAEPTRPVPFGPPVRPHPRRASMTAGVILAVVLLLSVTAVAATALIRPSRAS